MLADFSHGTCDRKGSGRTPSLLLASRAPGPTPAMGCCYSSENEDSDQVRPRRAGLGNVGSDPGAWGSEKKKPAEEGSRTSGLTEYGGPEGTDYRGDPESASTFKAPVLCTFTAVGCAGSRLSISLAPIPLTFPTFKSLQLQGSLA